MEHSFLSDFNIHEELFGNNQSAAISHQYYGPTQSVAPPSVGGHNRKSLPNTYMQATRDCSQAKLVGTKRRKLAQNATTPSVIMSGNGSECNDFPSASPFDMRAGNYDDDFDHQNFQINIESFLKQTEHFDKPCYENIQSSNNNTSTLSSQKYVVPSAPISSCATRRFTDYVTSSSNYYDDEDDNSFHKQTSSESSNKHIKKRQANKEAAIRSRLKKKALQDTIESEFTNMQAENNKLKLDNAALRAEN